MRRAGLDDRAAGLYDAALRRACVVLVHLVRELPEFQSATAVASLRRLTTISARLDELLERVTAVPDNVDRDDRFRSEYLAYTASALDRLDLLGLTMRHRPRLVLSMAYLSLGVTDVDPSSRRRASRDRMDSIEAWFEKTVQAHGNSTMRIETAPGVAQPALDQLAPVFAHRSDTAAPPGLGWAGWSSGRR